MRSEWVAWFASARRVARAVGVRLGPAARDDAAWQMSADPLVLAAAAGVGAALAALLELPVVIRLPLGLLGVLVLPGYAIGRALIARPLEPFERATVSGVLSLALVIIVAPILNLTPEGLRPVPLIVTLTALTLGALGVAAWRRARLVAREPWPRERVVIDLQMPGWAAGGTGHVRRSAWWAAVLALTALTFTLALRPTALTELFVLGAGGRADTYPTRVEVGQPMSVSIGITNQEAAEASFRVLAVAADAEVGSVGPIVVRSGETLTTDVAFTLASVGDDQEVQILLLREGQPGVYRSVRLWVDVLAGR